MIDQVREDRLTTQIGFTPDESEAWNLVGDAACKLLALPELHEMDRHEVCHAIHILQEKLLKRPAYRTYRQAVEKEAALKPRSAMEGESCNGGKSS